MNSSNMTDLARVRPVLALDAATCFAAGCLMAFAAKPVAALTGLSPDLLRGAGIALLPVAALFLFMARTSRLTRGLILFAVIGNLAWVAGSIAVLCSAGANAIGQIFVAMQAIAVAILALLEARDAFPRRGVA